MIKGILLDVDGVIIGEKIGFNSPHPHPDVLSELKKIRSGGIIISLVTAKPHFAIGDIINGASLDNVHITDGGAVIINPVEKRIVSSRIIDKSIAAEIIGALLNAQVYTEFYTVDDYFIQKSQVSNITDKHAHILQTQPQIVESLTDEVTKQNVTKVMPIAKDEGDKPIVAQLLKQFEGKVQISWGVHPVALPLQFGIVTNHKISKKEGANQVSESTKIPFTEMLGVGDSTSDWQFIENCRYAAAMGNASSELKKLVLSKGEGYSNIGPSVDENGIIDILEHFSSEFSANRVRRGAVHTTPADLRKTLIAAPAAQATWEDITPLARNEWICWITSAKKTETRTRRVKRAREDLTRGKRRPCCWAGCPHR